MSKAQILQEIRDEREAQDRQWGGRASDDTRSDEQWFAYIDRQEDLWIADYQQNTRQRLIKIAAIAVAAIEAIDRRTS